MLRLHDEGGGDSGRGGGRGRTKEIEGIEEWNKEEERMKEETERKKEHFSKDNI